MTATRKRHAVCPVVFFLRPFFRTDDCPATHDLLHYEPGSAVRGRACPAGPSSEDTNHAFRSFLGPRRSRRRKATTSDVRWALCSRICDDPDELRAIGRDADDEPDDDDDNDQDGDDDDDDDADDDDADDDNDDEELQDELLPGLTFEEEPRTVLITGSACGNIEAQARVPPGPMFMTWS